MTAAGTSHAAYLNRRYFRGLDGLRALSIVPIVWHHSTPRPLSGLLGQGPAGVSLFFCISGFLITTLLLREQRVAGTIALGSFYLRRALRIFPLFYLVLLAYVVFAWQLPVELPQRAHFFRSLPYYATYTANWFVDFAVPHAVLFSFAWSLCVEEQFYALWPLVLAATGRRWLWYGTILPLFLLISRPIAWGALLALALDEPRGFAWLERIFNRPLSAIVAFVATLAVLYFLPVPGIALDLCLLALVAGTVLTEQGALLALLETRAMRHVGRVSYGLYLLQLSAIGLVRRAFPSFAGSALFVFALSLPLGVLCATAAYAAVERPLLALRARFRPSIS